MEQPAQPSLYPFPEILPLVLCATIARTDDFVEINLWGTEHLTSRFSVLLPWKWKTRPSSAFSP